MDINKLIEEIAQEVYSRVQSGGTCGRYLGEEIGKKSEIAGMIDHTLLKPEATVAQIQNLCEEAKKHEFASVCVNPGFVKMASGLLENTGVKTCCVIGFPLGATTTAAKIAETLDAVANGATEVDMVINIGAAKSGNWDIVKSDIEGVVNAARNKALVKVIIESCLLTDEEKVKACTLAKLAGADFVKTSTGFSSGGATVDDIRLMRQVVGPRMGVKASGGVNTYKIAKDMIAAGATRIGTSSGIGLIETERTGIQKSAQGY